MGLETSDLDGKPTPRAGVRVPSTSNRHIVFLIDRLSSGGTTLTASACAIVADVFGAWADCDQLATSGQLQVLHADCKHRFSLDD